MPTNRGTILGLAACACYLSGLRPEISLLMASLLLSYAVLMEWKSTLAHLMQRLTKKLGLKMNSTAENVGSPPSDEANSAASNPESAKAHGENSDANLASAAHGASTGALVVPLVGGRRPISASEFDTLCRNAQDGGANSIMAAHILRKNVDLMILGEKRVDEMLETARGVQTTTKELFSLADEIYRLSRHAKMVAVNLNIEAARGGQEMAAFQPIAEEMGRLAAKVGELTGEVEARLTGLEQRTLKNEKICIAVGSQFADINRELEAFRAVMNRLEGLWSVQCEGLRTMEPAFIQKPKARAA